MLPDTCLLLSLQDAGLLKRLFQRHFLCGHRHEREDQRRHGRIAEEYAQPSLADWGRQVAERPNYHERTRFQRKGGGIPRRTCPERAQFLALTWLHRKRAFLPPARWELSPGPPPAASPPAAAPSFLSCSSDRDSEGWGALCPPASPGKSWSAIPKDQSGCSAGALELRPVDLESAAEAARPQVEGLGNPKATWRWQEVFHVSNSNRTSRLTAALLQSRPVMMTDDHVSAGCGGNLTYSTGGCSFFSPGGFVAASERSCLCGAVRSEAASVCGGRGGATRLLSTRWKPRPTQPHREEAVEGPLLSRG